MSVTASIKGYYRDLLKLTPADYKSDRRIALTLATQLPFPNGVVPRILRSHFLRADTDQRAEAIGNSCANGPAFDSLIILLRQLLAAYPDFWQIRDHQLFTLAFHDFGRSQVDDYIVKGKLLELLYPISTIQLHRVDVTLGELIWHPLITDTLWSHPTLSFFRRKTWAKKPGATSWEPYNLDDKFALPTPPFQPPDQGRHLNLSHHLSRKLGIHTIDGSSVAFAGLFPPIIPIITRGGQPLASIRTLTLHGPCNHRVLRDGTLAPVVLKRRYRLRALLNLADSDIRTFHQDTSPVVEQLDPDPALCETTQRPRERYLAKLARGAQARGWTFEDSPERYFLLVYVEYDAVQGASYRPASDQFGEYIPPLAGNGEQRWAAAPYLPLRKKDEKAKKSDSRTRAPKKRDLSKYVY